MPAVEILLYDDGSFGNAFQGFREPCQVDADCFGGKGHCVSNDTRVFSDVGTCVCPPKYGYRSLECDASVSTSSNWAFITMLFASFIVCFMYMERIRVFFRNSRKLEKQGGTLKHKGPSATKTALYGNTVSLFVLVVLGATHVACGTTNQLVCSQGMVVFQQLCEYIALWGVCAAAMNIGLMWVQVFLSQKNAIVVNNLSTLKKPFLGMISFFFLGLVSLAGGTGPLLGVMMVMIMVTLGSFLWGLAKMRTVLNVKVDPTSSSTASARSKKSYREMRLITITVTVIALFLLVVLLIRLVWDPQPTPYIAWNVWLEFLTLFGTLMLNYCVVNYATAQVRRKMSIAKSQKSSS